MFIPGSLWYQAIGFGFYNHTTFYNINSAHDLSIPHHTIEFHMTLHAEIKESKGIY